MSASGANLAEDLRLRAAFDGVRRKLLHERYVATLEKPISYWVLSSDRRLPRAFLDRTVGELVKTPFASLTATPGVGQKKMAGLLQLLRRALNETPTPEAACESRDVPLSDAEFDPDNLSEREWDRWRETIRQHCLESVPLGRVAVSLQDLPSVLWRTPFEEYLGNSLSELRQRRTHGEKRVRAVLQAFHEVQRLLGHGGGESRLGVRLVTRPVQRAENWLSNALGRTETPSVDELTDQVIRPLIDQLRGDLGQDVGELVAARLGIDGALGSVREQSHRLGVTRARVYQMFDECAEVMHVRWPEGRLHLRQFAETVASQYFGFGCDLVGSLQSLLFPERRSRPENEPAGTAGTTVARPTQELSHVDTSL